MGDVAVVRVQHLDGRDDLARDAERRADFECDAALDEVREQSRQTHAVHRVGDDSERTVVEAFGAAHDGKNGWRKSVRRFTLRVSADSKAGTLESSVDRDSSSVS